MAEDGIFVRQKLPVDFTSGFSGVDGFSGLLVLGTTRIDLYTGDIYNISGNAYISGFSNFSGFSGASGYSGGSGQSGSSGSSGYSGESGFSGASGISGFSGTSGFSGRDSSAGTVYFVHQESSDVVGARKLRRDPPDDALTTLTFTNVPADTTTALENWITEPSEPGTSVWGKGEYKLEIVARKTNGTEARLIYKMFRNDGGIRTQVGGDSIQSLNLTTTFETYIITIQLAAEEEVATTSRYEIEIYVEDIGGGGTQDIELQLEGITGTSADANSHIHTGVTSAFGSSGYSGTSGFSGASGFSGLSGFSANSGYSGQSGQSGYSGLSGESGTSGTSGYSGESGTSGFSGYSGNSGFSGYSGQSGYSGPSGFSGYSGESGSSGLSGTSGFSGYSGESGFSGSNGASGFSGYSGESGFSGASGPSGYSGYSGESGFSGYSAASGFSGTSGFSGASGPSGYSGESGFSGYSGISGVSGESGFSGYSAASGFSGTSGFSGASGPSGYSGYSGESGFSGYSGESGFSGVSGFSSQSGTSGESGFSGYSGVSAYSGYSGESGFSGFSGRSGFSGISGYSANTFSGTKYIFLPVGGAVDDVNVGEVTQMPFLEFAATSNERARWTVFAPDDQIAGTNVVANLHWSPRNTNTGGVFWFLETKSVAVGTSVSGANMTGTFVQAAPGVAYRLTSTGSNLFISGASMAAGDLLQITVGRSGAAGTDTYTTFANLHHVRLEYTAKKLVP